ncbi:MAG: Trm112 family protein [Betaproteobacteria bacterium]|nr:Trm112 family protein [Betaproteobacteria bacterium]
MDHRLLEILACPICKNSLRHDRQALELICEHDHLAFPIRDGIPVMLLAEARSTESERSEAQVPFRGADEQAGA